MTNEQTFNFEDSMKRLEEIVKSLESENQSLEKNLQLFEEGLKLSKDLKKHLDGAERKIEILTKDGGGNVKLEEFKEDEK
ncbi:MAG: exodeoxyribonuclease VII small subunit [Candidatus Neomarinimicrobiota bacterium]|nr:exodeoxyribonuclease VII small subunit [Candidatus Neomarinimicrobiota bacterium]